MKKFLAILLAAMMILAFAACGGAKEPTSYELALVTDKGTIDDKSFNQGAWEGLKAYADENNLVPKYYQPTEQSMDAYYETIGLAIEGGAKLVVCPGYLFENAVHKAQKDNPEVTFIILDGAPHNVTAYNDDGTVKSTYDNAAADYTIGPKTYSIFYKEEQAGFLAGYAIVKDGYTDLGFMGGMAVPAVIRYGYGFVQGAEYAAKEMGVASINMKYYYTGDFAATPENQTKAASWFASGTKCIFACGGAVGQSVMAAAEANSGVVIGVDVDQSADSTTVISSSMKNLKASVHDAVKAYYDGTFQGGQSVHLGADVNGVALPMASSKFTTFTQADYDAIFAKLSSDEGGLASGLKTDSDAADATALGTSIVKVTIDK